MVVLTFRDCRFHTDTFCLLSRCCPGNGAPVPSSKGHLPTKWKPGSLCPGEPVSFPCRSVFGTSLKRGSAPVYPWVHLPPPAKKVARDDTNAHRCQMADTLGERTHFFSGGSPSRKNGADRTRTCTPVKELDPKSSASASFATAPWHQIPPACGKSGRLSIAGEEKKREHSATGGSPPVMS